LDLGQKIELQGPKIQNPNPNFLVFLRLPHALNERRRGAQKITLGNASNGKIKKNKQERTHRFLTAFKNASMNGSCHARTKEAKTGQKSAFFLPFIRFCRSLWLSVLPP
jgi:hypothetical protein